MEKFSDAVLKGNQQKFIFVIKVCFQLPWLPLISASNSHLKTRRRKLQD